MAKVKVYEVHKGILPEQLAKKIKVPIKGVSLSEPVLKPFVKEFSDLETTVIRDGIEAYYSSDLLLLYAIRPGAFHLALDSPEIRQGVNSIYGIDIKTSDMVCVDLKDKERTYWSIVHEFIHAFSYRTSPDKKRTIFDFLPEEASELERLRKLFQIHFSYKFTDPTQQRMVLAEEIPSHLFSEPLLFYDSKVQDYLHNNSRLKDSLENAGYRLEDYPNLKDFKKYELRRQQELQKQLGEYNETREINLRKREIMVLQGD